MGNKTFKNQRTPIHLDQETSTNFNDHGDGDLGPNFKLNNANIDYAWIFYKYANKTASLQYAVDLEVGEYDVAFYKTPVNETDENELFSYIGIQTINHPGGKAKYIYSFNDAKPGDKIISVVTKKENGVPQFSSEASRFQVVDWDFDGDNLPNNYDDDDDGDLIPDIIEGNCEIDTDNDSYKDCQDIDSDNDGLLDSLEYTGDWDLDQIPNYLDSDSDGDGKSDNLEAYDTDNNGVSNLLWSVQDWDFDGMSNAFDIFSRTYPGNASSNASSSKYSKLDFNNNYLDDYLDNIQP